MTTTSTCWTSGLLGSFKRSCPADGDNYFDDNRDDDYEIIPETGGDGDGEDTDTCNDQKLVEPGGVQYVLVGNGGQLTPIGRPALVQVVVMIMMMRMMMMMAMAQYFRILFKC